MEWKADFLLSTVSESLIGDEWKQLYDFTIGFCKYTEQFKPQDGEPTKVYFDDELVGMYEVELAEAEDFMKWWIMDWTSSLLCDHEHLYVHAKICEKKLGNGFDLELDAEDCCNERLSMFRQADSMNRWKHEIRETKGPQSMQVPQA